MKIQNRLKIGMITTAILLIVLMCVSNLFTISDIIGNNFQHHLEMVGISSWPLLCYVIAKWFNFGEKIGFKPFMVDFIIHTIITIGLIWLFEELIFKYKYVSADVTAEIYMYVISVITFLLCKIEIKKIKLDKWDILCFTAITVITAVLWLSNQERIVDIVNSLTYTKAEVDTDGEFLNWVLHRSSMLKSSISSDFSRINVNYLSPMAKGCSLMWFSSVNGWHIPVAITGLCAVMIIFMTAYSRNTGNVLASVITFSFALKFVIGLAANLFLIFSTSVGIPFVKSIYDVVPLFFMLFLKEECKHIENDA